MKNPTLAQLFAGRGYFVFEPNYRGSNKLGNSHKAAIFKDAGAGPGRDVMAGLAQLKRSGLVDTTRIGVSGRSYGGYMTACTQSYQLFHALKDNGVTTKFIAWPVAAHNASDPVRQRERHRFWLDWMDTYLQPSGRAEAPRTGSNQVFGCWPGVNYPSVFSA